MSETFEQWKASHPSDTLTLSFDDHMHHQWRVELYGNTEAALRIKNEIRYACAYGCGPKGSEIDADIKLSHPFIQSDDRDYLKVEFWTGDESKILRAAEILANQAGLKLELM